MPPYSSGSVTPKSPSFFICSTMGSGNLSSASYSSACGMISLSTNWRTISMIACWSSVISLYGAVATAMAPVFWVFRSGLPGRREDTRVPWAHMPDQRDIAEALQQGLAGEAFAEMIRSESAREVLDETIGPLCRDDFEIAMVSGESGLRNEYRGTEGFVAAWRDWLTPFERFQIVIDDDVAGDGDVPLGFARQTGVLA